MDVAPNAATARELRHTLLHLTDEPGSDEDQLDVLRAELAIRRLDLLLR